MLYEIAESLINAYVGGSDYQDSDEHEKKIFFTKWHFMAKWRIGQVDASKR